MRDGYLRGSLSRPATQRQMDVLAAFVASGGSVQDAAEVVGIRPSTAERHLADLRARSGLTTEQLIYAGRAGGWLVVPRLEPAGRAENAPYCMHDEASTESIAYPPRLRITSRQTGNHVQDNGRNGPLKGSNGAPAALSSQPAPW